MELKKETGLSDPVLSDHLKWLWKQKYIDRDISTRKYHILKKARNKLPIIAVIDELNMVLRRGQISPVRYPDELEKMMNELSKPLQKNITIIANCISILHKSFAKMNLQIKDAYGENPFMRTRKINDGTILLDFKKYRG